jgi:uncharacterized protein (DUF3084 family)
VRRKRSDELGTVEDERAALREQWLELDGLKRELSERVRAVEERERELQATLAHVRRDGGASSPLPVPSADAAELERRAAALAERERQVAAREHTAEGAAAAVLPPAPSADEQRLAEIDQRLAALQEAEKAFVRTQQELAARSEAVTQRERLVAQREKELDQREDVADARPEVTELEARLRRLEAQRAVPAAPQPQVDDTQGFSGGFKKLQDQGTRRRPA